MKSVFLLQYELSRTQRKDISWGHYFVLHFTYKIPRAQNLSFLNFRIAWCIWNSIFNAYLIRTMKSPMYFHSHWVTGTLHCRFLVPGTTRKIVQDNWHQFWHKYDGVKWCHRNYSQIPWALWELPAKWTSQFSQRGWLLVVMHSSWNIPSWARLGHFNIYLFSIFFIAFWPTGAFQSAIRTIWESASTSRRFQIQQIWQFIRQHIRPW